MGHPLTSEETAAIEKYIANGGKVTKCPPKKMTEHVDWRPDNWFDNGLKFSNRALDPGRPYEPRYQLFDGTCDGPHETDEDHPEVISVDEAMKLAGWAA